MSSMNATESGYKTDMPTIILGYSDISIRVESDDEADLHWLDEFLGPAFEPTTSLPDWEVRLKIDPGCYQQWLSRGSNGSDLVTFLLDTGEIKLPVYHHPDGSLLIHDAQFRVFYRIVGCHVLLVAEKSKPRLRSALMRVVRELAMDQAQQNGGRLLHAACFAIDGRAVIITGPKEAGKTSLLSYALTTPGASYLSNDRLMLNNDGNKLLARGMPTVVSVRSGTLSLFPAFWDAAKRSRWRLHSTIDECASTSATPTRTWADGRLGLTPKQYCLTSDCDSIVSATPAMLLFPRRSNRPNGLRLTRLLPAQIAKRLATCHFGGSSNAQNRRRSEVFRVKTTIQTNTPSLETILRHLPAFDCELGIDAYDNRKGTDLIIQALSQPYAPGLYTWPTASHRT